MSASRIATSPFNCYWIASDSAGRFREFQYAACCRTAGRRRIVSEEECARCPFWRDPEPPADESGLRAA